MSMDVYETVAVRELNEQLAAANNFDLDALTLNQQGVLAPSQMKIIYSRIKWLGFFFLVLVGAGIYKYIENGLPEKGAQGYVAIVAYLLVTGIIGYYLLTALKNTSVKRVESMDGIGFSIYETSTDYDTGHESTDYYYRIGATRFSVKSKEAYYALVNEIKYRVYYLPKSKVLINIEALQSPPEQSTM
jgi:hypothetical protein